MARDVEEGGEGGGLDPIRFEAAPLRAKIVEALRRAIERGALKPGDRLVEKDLCRQLDVSRTSLREALREFESEGVVAPASARGLTVVRLKRRDAENIYLIRADLEALIAGQFVDRADDADMARARALCLRLVEAYRGGEFIRIVDAKRALYRHLCDVADNEVAHELLSRLTLRTAQLRRPSVVRPERQTESIREIERLLAALESRDRDAAREAARDHVLHAAFSALRFAAE